MLNQKLVVADRVSPLYDKVLIKPDEGELRSPGGIILPETAYKRSESGTVIAVGEGKLTAYGDLMELVVAPGDHVLFSRHRAAEIELSTGGETLLILPEEDIYAVLGEKAKVGEYNFATGEYESKKPTPVDGLNFAVAEKNV